MIRIARLRRARIVALVCGLVCLLALGYGVHRWYFAQPATEHTGMVLAPKTGALNEAESPVISAGRNGPKVEIIQKKVGTWKTGHEATMDERTIKAVRQWQLTHGLPPSGTVDMATWKAMNTGRSWTIDQWTTSSRVRPDATREERIEAMIRFTLEQQGSQYLWGGAGPADLGYDCSGLALQSMRAAGKNPGLSPVAHTAPGWLSTHYFAENPDFTHVPLAQKKRGDWIFYTDKGGTIRHMVLYLGDGHMVDSYGPGVRKRPYKEKIGDDRFVAPMVLRVFP